MGSGGGVEEYELEETDERAEEEVGNVDEILTHFRAAGPVNVYRGFDFIDAMASSSPSASNHPSTYFNSVETSRTTMLDLVVFSILLPFLSLDATFLIHDSSN